MARSISQLLIATLLCGVPTAPTKRLDSSPTIPALQGAPGWSWARLESVGSPGGVDLETDDEGTLWVIDGAGQFLRRLRAGESRVWRSINGGQFVDISLADGTAWIGTDTGKLMSVRFEELTEVTALTDGEVSAVSASPENIYAAGRSANGEGIVVRFETATGFTSTDQSDFDDPRVVFLDVVGIFNGASDSWVAGGTDGDGAPGFSLTQQLCDRGACVRYSSGDNLAADGPINSIWYDDTSGGYLAVGNGGLLTSVGKDSLPWPLFYPHLEVDKRDLLDVAVCDGRVAAVAGTDGYVAITERGTESWHELSITSVGDIRSIACAGLRQTTIVALTESGELIEISQNIKSATRVYLPTSIR